MTVIGTTSDASTALDVKDLARHFGGVKALDGLNFTVPTGSTVALIGPNGSGKSTCLNLLSGHDTPTRGVMGVFGQTIGSSATWRVAQLGIRRTYQLLRVFHGLSVYENVLLGAENAIADDQTDGHRVELWPDASATERADAAVEFVGLSERAAVLAGHLPGGQARLLELARAVAGCPALLLLDEPGAGLNDAEGEFLATRLTMLRDAGMSTLLVEHDMPLVMGVADSVVVINQGRVIATGTPAEVQANPVVQEAYLGAANADERLRTLKQQLREGMR